MDSYWPDGSLADLLDIHLLNYEKDFRAYWHLDAGSCPPDFSAEDWTLARLLDKVGEKLPAAARALRHDPEVLARVQEVRPWEPADAVAADLARYQIAQSRAEIELASEAVHRLFEGKKRLIQVQLLVSPHNWSSRALAFVDRMVQCFVWSFDTELTIMARSVMEAALEEAFSDDQMAQLGFARTRYGFQFWQYRDAASKTGRFNDQLLEALEQIRQAGNDAVHAAPGIHPKPIATLVRTVACLRALFPEPQA